MNDPDAHARTALRLIGPDPQNWVPDRPGIDHNVMIVGGGQSGSAFAFALRRAGIGKIAVIDMAADEARAGVWLNAARMNVLRTPKTLPGPECGIAALSFQAWYEARNGEAAYAAVERIPRAAWAEYLAWYRRFLGIPVRYRTRLLRIEPAERYFRVHLEVEGVEAIETARKIILANGVAGNGGTYVPPALTEGLPPHLYAHTADAIDFAGLRGKKVAVVGGAASAFDAAGVALEAGAASVDLFARRAGSRHRPPTASSPSISRSPAPATSSSPAPARNWPSSLTTSCYGATATSHRPTSKIPILAPILTSARLTNILKKRRVRRPI